MDPASFPGAETTSCGKTGTPIEFVTEKNIQQVKNALYVVTGNPRRIRSAMALTQKSISTEPKQQKENAS